MIYGMVISCYNPLKIKDAVCEVFVVINLRYRLFLSIR